MHEPDYDASTMELTPGQTVDGWVVERRLGQGAMALVYRVREQGTGRLAALKVLARTDPILEERLRNEARAQGALDHAGIVGVLGELDVDGNPALLLELVQGPDLAALLAEERLPSDTALDLFRQITTAIAVAHAAGLVHRDLKPSNVLVQRDATGRWTAKVGDFGLVKTLDGDLTATRAIVGTPRTMAPEQMRSSRTVDERADVFSLGALLFELMTGRPAFAADNWLDLYAAKVASRFPDPGALAPGLPDAVHRTIVGALQGSPERRIPSCDTLLAVLDGARFDVPSADRTFDALDQLVLCPACHAPDPAGPPQCKVCGAETMLAARYQLVDELHRSEHTRVFRALDHRDGSSVVVRALLWSAVPVLRRRFERGVRLSRELHHPRIVGARVGPFDEHDQIFEVRPFVEGQSLDDEMRHRRYDEAE
ncbi:MAG: protein kinase, partial [Myxococcota bacterium]